MRSATIALLASLILVLPGCGASVEPSNQLPLLTSLPRPLQAGEQAAIQANNAFSFRLLGTVTQAEPGANTLVSPLSVSLALGMVLNGARGLTLDSMALALGFGSVDLPTIKSSYKSLIQLLLGLDQTTDLTIANSIWAAQGWDIEPAFLADAHDYFDAVAQTLDFASPAAVTTINDWVNQKTRGKIPTILESISADEILFAINATYFKAAWRDAFRPADTRDGPFTTLDGRAQSVPFMHQSIKAPFLATTELQAIDLWYGNGAFSMTVVLPAPGRNVNDLARDLDPARWTTLTGGLTEAKLDLALPKFTLEYKRSLSDDLKAIGMRRAFDFELADLTGISAIGNPYITRVDHKTYIKVNEEGTEAAAVTSVGVGVTSAPPSMVVDRPFLFFIRERLSGTILFAGRITAVPGA